MIVKMVNRILLILVLAIPGWAQFTQLATTDDAQQLYFASQLRIEPAAPAAPEYRIFHDGPLGTYLFAERGSLTPSISFSTNSDGMLTPQVTGDGSLIGLTAHNICSSQTPCTQPSSVEGLLRGSMSADLGPGTLQLSRNGRWAVLTPQVAPPTTVSQATLFDLQMNQSVPIPPPPFGISSAVASTGAVLVMQTTPSAGLGIWQQGHFSPLAIPGAIRPWALSDDGSTVVFMRLGAAGAPPSLIARNVGTGVETTIYTSSVATQVPNFLGITNDGSQVLFNAWSNQAAGPAYLWNAANGATLISLDPGEIATAGTLGGLGTAGYLATSEGRIVKFAVSAGIATVTYTAEPKTPYISFSPNNWAPGSQVQLQGTLPGSMDLLTGLILLGGRPIPILSATTGDIQAQIPWEQNTGQVSLTVDVFTNSLFQQSDLVLLFPIAPTILPADPGEQTILGLKFVKGDFSGLVTAQPAPGDIVIAYFTGLGPVNGNPQTGVAAPTDAFFAIQDQLTCQFLPGQSSMRTLYAGLAPLLIGIYQVAFQLPDNAGKSPISGLQCSLVGRSGSASFSVVGAPAP
jgi:uncharacterized protein (TIGR03437 family)